MDTITEKEIDNLYRVCGLEPDEDDSRVVEMWQPNNQLNTNYVSAYDAVQLNVSCSTKQ